MLAIRSGISCLLLTDLLLSAHGDPGKGRESLWAHLPEARRRQAQDPPLRPRMMSSNLLSFDKTRTPLTAEEGMGLPGLRGAPRAQGPPRDTRKGRFYSDPQGRPKRKEEQADLRTKNLMIIEYYQ